MFTKYDKAIAAVLMALAAWLNQKYGLALPVDSETLILLAGGLTSAIVYLVPNKGA